MIRPRGNSPALKKISYFNKLIHPSTTHGFTVPHKDTYIIRHKPLTDNNWFEDAIPLFFLDPINIKGNMVYGQKYVETLSIIFQTHKH